MSLNEDAEVQRGAAGMPEVPEPRSDGGLADVDDVEEARRDVVDPELGINVVDLGLVYDIHVDEGNVATLDMTLTSAACSLTDVTEDQTRAALTGGPGGGLVDDVRIYWIWMPPLGPGQDHRRRPGTTIGPWASPSDAAMYFTAVPPCRGLCRQPGQTQCGSATVAGRW